MIAFIYISDSPDTENLLSLVETIYMYRSQKNFEEEEKLYFFLIDIMRQPMIYAQLTGSCMDKKKDDKGWVPRIGY